MSQRFVRGLCESGRFWPVSGPSAKRSYTTWVEMPSAPAASSTVIHDASVSHAASRSWGGFALMASDTGSLPGPSSLNSRLAISLGLGVGLRIMSGSG
jgi:hypothetical protein